ncbi:type I restriction endonuclease subunit R [Lactococcus petauri]|uniref:type I restriction endonuclease subunit R n=1 Tax=Lactococcus petauri TaxID=1940789 RepID=UPI001BCB8AFD|nr:HsdR family type I site-specific deoxyribonuclease [Lactococcus petauri]MBS4460728.1 type I restriction endonuclease subunit R [Lactococcus petauri]
MTAEKEIENQFIHILSEAENQWRYREDIRTESALWQNLRKHLNRINQAQLAGTPLTDVEFERIKVEFGRLTATPFQASQWLRGENGVAQISLEREDTSKIVIEFFRNKDVAGGISSYEVVNQIVPATDKVTRGDVTLLINGLPIIHVELKNESAKDGYMQAYRQIERYALDGFFDGIYATTQIFIVSNKVQTKYFARPSENTVQAYRRMEKFLFNWRTAENVAVDNLFDFTRQVLRIPAAHELISQYTVLVDDQKSQKFLMVLRPYQIHAIKEIRKKAAEHKGGFIWHATGSGKTITSFVATKLLAQNATGVDRTIMVVDRTDLDAQTQDEFTKFASEFHTGQTSGTAKSNTLIVGIKNQHQLTRSLLSKKNNNTILVTTIQKLSAAMRAAKYETEKEGTERFAKLRSEHIVFIVDEAHRAVSDEEMKKIKKLFPNSTWFGLTGTPIFEDNKKQENGTFARTTTQQYGDLLHAYTTKNAMDDRAVLNFQVEYHSLLNQDEQEALLAKMTEEVPSERIDQEKLIKSDIYEDPKHIEAMLHKIFTRRSLVKKFNVQNGYPTMSAILTTHSIAQAKRIYHKLQEMKREGTLFYGKDFDDKRRLIDQDFPRVAITFSTNPDQLEKNQQDDELLEIMKEYSEMYDQAAYTDEKLYNQNINKRLARKEAQYQKDGQWLDLVIVVDRLLTGFDAPTIQTLYADREMNYQKLLQAFSRTNRLYPGKDNGMIVTFRKPATMKKNVEETFRLFSNEKQNWQELIPPEYQTVKTNFEEVRKAYQTTKNQLEENPNDLKRKIAKLKAFQKMEKVYKALKSYDEYEDEIEQFISFDKKMDDYRGNAENLRGEIKHELEDSAGDKPDIDELLQDIEFSSQLNATHEDKVDSFYINQLLKNLQENMEGAEEKFDEEIKLKDPMVQPIYHKIKHQIKRSPEEVDIKEIKYKMFNEEINNQLQEESINYALPEESVKSAFNEFQPEKTEIPYLASIVDNMTLSKGIFEEKTGKKYRSRTKVMENVLKDVFTRLQKLKEEI